MRRLREMSALANNRWIFDEIQLIKTPTRSDNIGQNEELLIRQKGTNFIREIAELLKLKPICMNTAIVYFHRFFTFRSLKRFDINQIAVCCLFLASKFEEQPIFKEHIIKVSHICQNKTQLLKDDEEYKKECDKLISNENELLLTLGFDLSVRHPHSVIINASQISVINKAICQKAYLIANDLLRLTTICLQYNPTFIACVCIHISSHYLNIPITATNDNSDWCQLIDPNVSLRKVEEVAKKYKHYINAFKLQNDGQRKRTLSYDNCSPESAYSSSSGNSPIYQNVSNLKYVSSNPMNGDSNDRHSNKDSHHKRFRSEQNDSLSHSTNKTSKNSSFNTLSNSYSKISLTNSKLVPNDVKAVHNNNSSIYLLQKDLTISKTGLSSKVRKSINIDDNFYNCKTNKNIIANLPKTADNIFSSSTETLKIAKNSKFGKKCLMNPKNFTITFSNDSFKDKNNDSSKSVNSIRIVRESGANTKQIVKIES